MTWQDTVNGSYECLGGLLVWLNVYRLYKDKIVRGITLTTAGFFATWSWWNLYYYPHLNQWISFIGGLNIGAANLVWILMAIHYTKEK